MEGLVSEGRMLFKKYGYPLLLACAILAITSFFADVSQSAELPFPKRPAQIAPLQKQKPKDDKKLGALDCKQPLDKSKTEKDPKKKQKLKEQWKQCVKQQCPNKPEKKGAKEACKADKDCQTFCEENRSGGKIDCCKGGPKEKPSCLDRVEGKCVKGPSSIPKKNLPSPKIPFLPS